MRRARCTNGPVVVLVLVLALPACVDQGRRSPGTPERAIATPETTPLDTYVQTPDPSYSYHLFKTLKGEGHTAHVLEMTSQTWRSADEVDRTVWRHWLTVIEPETVTSNVALLYITGGDNDDPAPDEVDSTRRRLAVATNSVVAELRMVPNQPLTFIGEETEPRREDALIAHAWDKHLRTGDETWLPRLPMTKSAVRAMDTVTAFCGSPEGGNLNIDQYVVAGRSKRGWTTWTTAAVDDRVVAIVPIVIDLLNMEESFEHHYRAYGFWAPAVEDYVDMGITDWIGTEQMKALRKIVEPYEYRSRLTMPKLVINASGDEFFVPDSSRFYFKDLVGEKHLRYLPNADHSLTDTDAADTVLAYYRAIVNDKPRPEFSWTFEPDGSIQVRTTGPISPSRVLLWRASNPESRDFRLDTTDKTWTSSILSPKSDGLFAGRVEEPVKGWTAFFVELTYPSGGREPFKFTTEVRILPDTLPFSFERQ